jgi:crotonobetainyl-CoA:carnitine CoA-transferase CaiB-like acyl-CoA transferase
VTGYPDWAPTMNHHAYGDQIGGLNSAAALIAAIYHKRRTGEGQFVDLSQVECLFPLVAPWVIEQSIKGEVGPRIGNRHPVHAPHGVFRCAGDDEWVLVAVTDDAAWRALCAVIERPDLAADPALASAEGRRGQQDRLEAAIRAWTAERTPDEAMEALQGAGVAAGAARAAWELPLVDPHLAARGYWQEIDRAVLGAHLQPSATFREGPEPYPVRFPAPTLGQHTREVLSRILGLSEAEMDRLEAMQVIGEAPIPATARGPRSAAAIHAAARAGATPEAVGAG